jgi:predicted O-linked N-acetylglucosamine transferase (SPINDLY family)
MADSASAQPGETEIAGLRSLLAARRYADAGARAREVIRNWPRHPAAWQVLVMALGAENRYSEAIPVLRSMLEHWPGDHETWVNLGNSLRKVKQPEEALKSYATAVQFGANSVPLRCALGDLLIEAGDHAAAEPHFREALALDAASFAAQGGLGNALLGLGRAAEAEACMRRAIALRPNAFQGYMGLASALRIQNHLLEAEEAGRRALALQANSPETHTCLGAILHDQGRHEEAIKCYRRALDINPSYFPAHNNLGSALVAVGSTGDAVVSFRKAIEIAPGNSDGHNNLGKALLVLGLPEDAAISCRRALEIRPDFANAHANLGTILFHLGDHPGAQASLRRAIEFDPDLHSARSNLLFVLSHEENMEAATLFAEHRAYGKRVEGSLGPAQPIHANSRDPDRELRIGFVSGDFRSHAVAYFIEPLLEELAQTRGLALHAYSNHPAQDDVTKRLQKLFVGWNQVSGIPDATLEARIRADKIDILVDLSGHTGESRLLTFARKPAPLQVSCIGYPGTSGLATMDYYLADKFFLPLDSFASQFTEKIVHLPTYATFRPLSTAPPVNPLPALGNGYVTFASFNRQNKITPSVIRHWSALLHAVPRSRMLVAALFSKSSAEPLRDAFGREGIAPDRLAFRTLCGLQEYLELHHQVDVCLDTLAYTGGTTILHALWMGVPTLTVADNLPPRRLGAVIARHAGLGTFVARNSAEFVTKGARLAGDLTRLARIRSDLRHRFASSPMGNARAVAAGFERAFRVMWKRWCAGKAPKAFSVQ